jgi:starch synthase (maltosyl-transferring)
MNLKTKLQNTEIAADSVPLSLAGRLAIEAVSPEIDAGAWPIKSSLGSAIEVSADIFSDGHDVLACDLL